MAKKVARAVQSMDQLSKMTTEELTALDEVGAVVAESIRAFFGAEGNRAIVERLRVAGVSMAAETKADRAIGDSLKGLSFVVSGVFVNFTRDSIKEAIENNGGKVGSSISRKTSYVVAGSDMGPAKRSKAEELGVPVISEDEFTHLIGE